MRHVNHSRYKSLSSNQNALNKTYLKKSLHLHCILSLTACARSFPSFAKRNKKPTTRNHLLLTAQFISTLWSCLFVLSVPSFPYPHRFVAKSQNSIKCTSAPCSIVTQAGIYISQHTHTHTHRNADWIESNWHMWILYRFHIMYMNIVTTMTKAYMTYILRKLNLKGIWVVLLRNRRHKVLGSSRFV